MVKNRKTMFASLQGANILKRWGLGLNLPLSRGRRGHGGRDSGPASELELATNYGKVLYQVDHRHYQPPSSSCPVAASAATAVASTSANITGRATRRDSVISGDIERGSKFSTPSASVYSNLSQVVQVKQSKDTSKSGATKLLKKIAKSTSSTGISSSHEKADKGLSSSASSQSSPK